MHGFAEALRAITDPGAKTLRCEECGAEFLEECDRRKHRATTASFAAMVARENRIWLIERAALGALQ